MKKLIYFSLLISLTSLSCKEKNKKPYCTENPGECQSVLEAKKFFAFKQGSWWVYEEETSGERDSMYVTSSYVNYSNYDFDTRIKSALTGYEYHYWPMYIDSRTCNEVLAVQGKCLYIKRSKGKTGDYLGESYCFFVNYKIGHQAPAYNTQYANNRITVANIQSNFIIGTTNFSKTVKIYENNSIVEGYQPTNHYYSTDVGLIRKELLDSNEVWNLVNYHIEH